MSEDRLAALEQRLAKLERDLAAMRTTVSAVTLRGASSPAEELTHYDVPPISVEKLRRILIEAGWDPTKNEASREIIAMRGE
jgi:hypothetical protein